MWNCVHCGRENEIVQPQCQACGAFRPMSEAPAKQCVRCGRRFPARYGFCGACGVTLQPLPPAPAPGARPGKRAGELTAGQVIGQCIFSLLLPLFGIILGVMQLRGKRFGLGALLLGVSFIGIIVYGTLFRETFWEWRMERQRPF